MVEYFHHITFLFHTEVVMMLRVFTAIDTIFVMLLRVFSFVLSMLSRINMVCFVYHITFLFRPGIAGDLVYQWFMKTANDCRTRDEYHRYHAELTVFLNKPATKRAIGNKGVNAIKK